MGTDTLKHYYEQLVSRIFIPGVFCWLLLWFNITHVYCIVLFTVSRSKMMAIKSVSRLRGNHSNAMYPQPEGQFGECMSKYGRDFGESSVLGWFLVMCLICSQSFVF